MFDIPCVIFAGGKSSRMGEDKALLPFATYPTLVEYQYTRLSKIFNTVYISCKNTSNFDFNANFIEDDTRDTTFAPTAGFIAAFAHIENDTFFALSVDTPFINENIITKLLKEDSSQFDATIAKTDEGIQPLCGIYHRTLQKEFLQMQKEQNHKLGLLLKKAKTHFCFFKDKTPFFNMNHPHEYKKALQKIESLNY